MKPIITCLLLAIILSACNIEKRHYRKGFHVDIPARKKMRMKTYPAILLEPREPQLTASVSSRPDINDHKQISNYKVYDRNRKHYFNFLRKINFNLKDIFKPQKKNNIKSRKHFNFHRPNIFVKHGRKVKVHHWRRK